MSVGGLRRSNPETLQYKTPEVLALPLGQVEPSTMVDLVALSEIPDQLPTALARDLKRFRDNCFRAVEDLPDGPALADFLDELAEIEAQLVPSSLRELVAGLLEERKHAASQKAIQRCMAVWESDEPADLVLPTPDNPDAPAPAPRPRKEVVESRGSGRRRTTTVVDERREEWIREDVLARLANYGPTGLKEPIVLAGARHRAPWNDLTEAEILVILRRMKREGTVRFSAGRWMLNR